MNRIILMGAGLKMMMFYGYHSTDFEVHRNWLALTTALPISKWYFEDRSIWTLDYPPFFGYFQFLLGIIAKVLFETFHIDNNLLNVENFNDSSEWTVFYLRMTVLVTEGLMLGYAAHKYSSTIKNSNFLYFSLFLNPGLFIVDHIHFQYNGFLYGILLLSLYHIKVNNLVLGGSLFLSLVLLKHIFLYIALGYFLYYLQLFKMPKKLFQLFISFSFILFAAFYPFRDHLDQILSRLFPFKRGLVHALWAPNAWAVYIFIDRVLAKYFRLNVPSMTRGIVGDTEFAILPNPTPLSTIAITCLFFIGFSAKFMKNFNYKGFVKLLQQLALSSVLFGWHVHEKALLLPAFLNLIEFEPNTGTFLLQTATISSQLPLLFEQESLVIWLATGVLMYKLPYIYGLISKDLRPHNNLRAICKFQTFLIFVSLILKQSKAYPFLYVMLVAVTNGLIFISLLVNQMFYYR